MRILISLIVLCFSFPAWAQDWPVALKAGQVLQGEFVQKRFLQGFERPIISSGNFHFSEGTGLLWKTLTPFATELLINKDGITQSVDGQETLKVSVQRFPALETLHDVLSKSMLGQWDVLEEKFGAKLTPNESGWTLDFKAKTDAPFEALHLAGQSFLQQLVLVKPKGDRDEISFSKQIVVEENK